MICRDDHLNLVIVKYKINIHVVSHYYSIRDIQYHAIIALYDVILSFEMGHIYKTMFVLVIQ